MQAMLTCYLSLHLSVDYSVTGLALERQEQSYVPAIPSSSELLSWGPLGSLSNFQALSPWGSWTYFAYIVISIFSYSYSHFFPDMTRVVAVHLSQQSRHCAASECDVAVQHHCWPHASLV